jgi:hypothetical protein
VKTEFITCIGGEDENGGADINGKRAGIGPGAPGLREEENEERGGNVVYGPVLPTMEYRRLL